MTDAMPPTQPFDPANGDSIWPGFERPAASLIRVVHIDDHSLVREGIGGLLSLESDIRIVGATGDLPSGIDMVRRLQPDLVICDLQMPGFTGFSAVKNLREQVAGVPVLVLTAMDSIEHIRESFRAGAIGYVRKDALRAELVEALRCAAAGRPVTCNGVGAIVTRGWLREAKPARLPEHLELNPEDRLIIRLIALGQPTRRIAAELRKSVKVLEKYRANLLRRLGLNCAAAVTRYAIRCNIVTHQEMNDLVPSE